MHDPLRAASLIAVTCALILSFAETCSAQDAPTGSLARSAAGPWGISSSASGFRNHAEWLPKMAATGVTTVRLFPEWHTLEPKQGEWNWDSADALVEAARKNNIEINAVLMGSAPWSSRKIHAFPMDDLLSWQKFVGAAAERYKGKIRYWEVWNEGNGGFNDDKHTTADYAKLAIATYEAVKKANPDARVGLSVASYDPAYLQQTILAMKAQGKPNCFDYLCLHPYELADGLADPDGEIPFLWMSQLLRDGLKVHAPEKTDCEIWLTEVGRRLGKHGGRNVTEEQAAADLVKLYVMALAQGITCTQWFEAQDPVGEDQGFGLLSREGNKRKSYEAFQRLTKYLGKRPKYLGFMPTINDEDPCYRFVFSDANNRSILVTWSRVNSGEFSPLVSYGPGLEILNLVTGSSKISGDNNAVNADLHPMTNVPHLFVSAPDDEPFSVLRHQPFPYGGKFGNGKHVELTLGERRLGDKHSPKGIHFVGHHSAPTLRFPDGSTGILVRGDQGANFYVHPSFANLQQREFYVRVTARRIAPGNVGFNLIYEVADSHGKSPYRNRGIWYSLGPGDGWQTHTWHLTDACFAKMWGFDFSIRPEQSVPFVIGKVEVSTEPFVQ